MWAVSSSPSTWLHPQIGLPFILEPWTFQRSPPSWRSFLLSSSPALKVPPPRTSAWARGSKRAWISCSLLVRSSSSTSLSTELISSFRRVRACFSVCASSSLPGCRCRDTRTSRSCGRGPVSPGSAPTFGVVQEPLHEDRVLGESLRHQQDALLNAMATQQGAAASTLNMTGKTGVRRDPGPARLQQKVQLLVLTLMNCCSLRSRARTSL